MFISIREIARTCRTTIKISEAFTAVTRPGHPDVTVPAVKLYGISTNTGAEGRWSKGGRVQSGGVDDVGTLQAIHRKLVMHKQAWSNMKRNKW